jgi:hypothetical protein
VRDDVKTTQASASGRGANEPRQHLNGRCLPSAVWSKETENFSGIDGERDAVYGDSRTEALAQALDLDERRGHSLKNIGRPGAGLKRAAPQGERMPLILFYVLKG